MATRRERVVLDLEDNFTTGMARATAATAMFRKSLGDLDGATVDADQGMDRLGKRTDGLGSSLRRGGPEIDKFSGRLALMRDTMITLGPALAPIGAGIVPAFSALAFNLGVAASAGGTAALALSGLGDALGALNDYQLAPTAENLNKVRLELEKLGPSGAHFVRFLDDLEPALRSLQQAARDGLLPGLEVGITALMDDLPQIRTFVFELATVMGELAASSGQALTGERFEAFFEYLRTVAAPTLEQLGRTIGFFAEGFANLVVGLAPATRDFNDGLEDMALRFAEWSRGLDDNQSFQEFLAYVRESGPAVAEFVGELAQAGAAIAQAMAPVGSVVLSALTRLLEILGALAASPFGSVFASALVGLTAYNRAALVATGVTNRLNGGLRSITASGGKALGVMGALALASNDTFQSMDLANTATLGLAGAWAGPWGAAAGAAIGLSQDVASANDDVTESLERVKAALDSADPESANLDALKQQLDDARQKVIDLANTLNDPSYTDPGDLMTSFKNAGEGVFGRDDYEEAYAAFQAVQEQYDKLKGAQERLNGTWSESTVRLRAQTAALQAGTEAMRARRDEALAAFDAETRWGQAVKDARVEAKRGGDGIDAMTKAGRANREALSELASAWNDQSEAVQNTRGRFAHARQTFIDTAEAMGVPKKAARELAAELLEIPEKRQTKVTADTNAATTAIRSFADLLHGIRDEDVYINVKRRYDTAAALGVGPAAINNRPETRRDLSARPAGRLALPTSLTVGRGAVDDKATLFGGAGLDPLLTMYERADAVAGGLGSLKRELAAAAASLTVESRCRRALVKSS